MNLKFDDGRWDEYIAKSENGKLNIYSEENLLAVNLALREMEGPSERFEFLAKTLLTGKPYDKFVVLATPIYVAKI